VWDYFTVGRDKQNVVECKGFRNREFDHKARAGMGRRLERIHFRFAD
jgi:hypothetical protein